jgi:RimJ/RimL family protein N-acetyltransferase
MNYTIVPTAEPHFSGLFAAIDTVARERKYLAFLQAPAQEKSFAFYRNIVENDLCQFVALEEDKVVGWCDILPISSESRAHIGILGIGLVPHARHRGLGAKLLQAAIAKAWAKGMTRIELSVRAGNTTAKALYERFGFEVEGVGRKAYLVGGKYEDAYVMALLRMTPNPSIEGTLSGLRPPSAPHVKR